MCRTNYKFCLSGSLRSPCATRWVRASGPGLLFPEGGNANVWFNTHSCTVIISVSPRETHRHVKEASGSLPHPELSHLCETSTWKAKCASEITSVVFDALCLRASDTVGLGWRSNTIICEVILQWWEILLSIISLLLLLSFLKWCCFQQAIHLSSEWAQVGTIWTFPRSGIRDCLSW